MERTKTYGHSDGCRYNDDDTLMYAFMDIGKERMILISAYEYPYFDTYLEFAKNEDKDVEIDYEQSDDLPYQIIYGGMMLGDKVALAQAIEMAHDMNHCAFLDIEEEKVNVSGYQEIVFFQEDALQEYYIPFAALMQTPHTFENRKTSITLFPALANHFIWESMVNRPFVLACRESSPYYGDVENWQDAISKDQLMKAYEVADKVMD